MTQDAPPTDPGDLDDASASLSGRHRRRYEEPSSSIVRDGIAIVERLTLHRIVLSAVFAIGLIVLYTLWETRLTWAPYLWESSAAQIGVVIAFVLLVGALGLHSVQQQLSTTQAGIQLGLQRQVDKLTAQVAELTKDKEALREALAEVLRREARLIERDEQSKAQLQELREQIRLARIRRVEDWRAAKAERNTGPGALDDAGA